MYHGCIGPLDDLPVNTPPLLSIRSRFLKAVYTGVRRIHVQRGARQEAYEFLVAAFHGIKLGLLAEMPFADHPSVVAATRQRIGDCDFTNGKAEPLLDIAARGTIVVFKAKALLVAPGLQTRARGSAHGAVT